MNGRAPFFHFTDMAGEAAKTAQSVRQTFVSALDTGALPFIPQNDLCDTSQITNPVTHLAYHQIFDLFLKEYSCRRGFKTPEYLTSAQAQTAFYAGNKADGRALIEGSRGVTVITKTYREYGAETVRLYNMEQITDRETIYRYGSAYSKPIPVTSFTRASFPQKRGAFQPIACSSTVPAEYIGQYYIANTLNADFIVNGDQAACFTRKVKNYVYHKDADGDVNPFAIYHLLCDAEAYCRSRVTDFAIRRTA
ncbi:MAG: hypothetical protein LBS97_03700 [Treponema sp.]|jgi:hypothetical protein|nr:hypothetical protein [Treponema sp.]